MTHFRRKLLTDDNDMNAASNLRKRFSYHLLMVALIANLATGLSAAIEEDDDLPRDLWCIDVTEFCNRYLDLPRPECIAKLNEICIEEPLVQENASSNGEQSVGNTQPNEEPSQSANESQQSETDPPQWLQNLVSEVFNPKNRIWRK
ncbi:uncharacterized protein LOC101901171 [Musca domestica]|uniref:Uncharacterized protein LOC101901171 n=1 Tax=Musca domestica TaxID=7370 RepID=A0A9J7HY98_MUSDO|nr:uncharacterized protein LOC101901171 [Musca domestica]